jgi:hypothetical protein
MCSKTRNKRATKSSVLCTLYSELSARSAAQIPPIILFSPLDKPGKSGIIPLFQAEAARFSPTRIMFCAGHGTLFQDVYAWTGGFTRPFFMDFIDWEVYRP